PSGWPYLISVVFQMFGVDENYVFTMNNFIYCAGILIVFLIAWTIFGGFRAAFLSALIFALIPHNLIWSNTAAAEPAAVLFSGLVVLSLFLYLRWGRVRHLFLFLLLVPIACQIRPESGLIGLWALIAAVLISPPDQAGTGRRNIIRRREAWSLAVIPLAFLLPHLLHVYAVSGEAWGAEGAKFSRQFFFENLITNGGYYLSNGHFPVVFTILALVGLILGGGKSSSATDFRNNYEYGDRYRLLLMLWFLLFFGIFLFFYAGSFGYGADVRFSLVGFMPLALLAGLGGDWLCRRMEGIFLEGTGGRAVVGKAGVVLTLVIVFLWLQFLPLIRTVGQEAWAARYDHYYAKKFIEKIPRRSVIITQIPTMFLLWGQGAIQTYAGVYNYDVIARLMKTYDGNVYFHKSYWCNSDVGNEVNLCNQIGDIYKLEPIVTAREQDFEYGLYKIIIRK
ncbi:MAG: glycosyltransferase family 39 protein, partial [Smithellaceae bacterium]|nr:glycosyltransferase family 39 protein [Smithellaceae bacterium]